MQSLNLSHQNNIKKLLDKIMQIIMRIMRSTSYGESELLGI